MCLRSVALVATLLIACGGSANPGLATATPAASVTSAIATPTPTPNATTPPIATSSAPVRPSGFTAPGECAYVGDARVQSDRTTWLLDCGRDPVKARSLMTNALVAQAWQQCGAAAGTTYFRRDAMLTLLSGFENRPDGDVQLDQKPRTGDCGP